MSATLTQAKCFESASRILSRALLRVLASDPREAAELAYIHKVTPSVAELESKIRQMQAEKIAALKEAE